MMFQFEKIRGGGGKRKTLTHFQVKKLKGLHEHRLSYEGQGDISFIA